MRISNLPLHRVVVLSETRLSDNFLLSFDTLSVGRLIQSEIEKGRIAGFEIAILWQPYFLVFPLLYCRLGIQIGSLKNRSKKEVILTLSGRA